MWFKGTSDINKQYNSRSTRISMHSYHQSMVMEYGNNKALIVKNKKRIYPPLWCMLRSLDKDWLHVGSFSRIFSKEVESLTKLLWSKYSRRQVFNLQPEDTAFNWWISNLNNSWNILKWKRNSKHFLLLCTYGFKCEGWGR